MYTDTRNSGLHRPNKKVRPTGGIQVLRSSCGTQLKSKGWKIKNKKICIRLHWLAIQTTTTGKSKWKTFLILNFPQSIYLINVVSSLKFKLIQICFFLRSYVSNRSLYESICQESQTANTNIIILHSLANERKDTQCTNYPWKFAHSMKQIILPSYQPNFLPCLQRDPMQQTYEKHIWK